MIKDWLPISGTLTTVDGTPLSGQDVAIRMKRKRRGCRWFSVEGVTTNDDGQYEFRIPRKMLVTGKYRLEISSHGDARYAPVSMLAEVDVG